MTHLLFARNYAGGRRFALAVLTLVGCQAPSFSASVLPKLSEAPKTIAPALYFERNTGQASPGVEFLAHADHSLLLLERGRVVLSNPDARQSDPLTMAFQDARTAAIPDGTEPQMGRVNYLNGNNPAQWHTNISTFARVKYADLYAGVDLVFYGTSHKLEYDFIVAPGADPDQIGLRFSRGGRQAKLLIDGEGTLSTDPDAIANFGKPTVYQDLPTGRRTIEASYRIRNDGRVGFKLGAYDHRRQLIIDPVIAFSTYFGNSLINSSGIVAVKTDPAGHIYVLAQQSGNYIAKNAFQPKLKGAYDVYLAKFDASGTYLYYATYLGGSQYDNPVGLAVDWRGRAAIAGSTTSRDFPVKNALQTTFPSSVDPQSTPSFVSVLDESGSALVFSTYLSGTAEPINQTFTSETLNCIAMDENDHVFVAGVTAEKGMPITSDALQASIGGGAEGTLATQSGYLAAIQASTGELTYGSYLGGAVTHTSGSVYTYINALASDKDGSVVLAGITSAVDLPVKNALYPTLPGLLTENYWQADDSDAFLFKFDKSMHLDYGTYFGKIVLDSFNSGFKVYDLAVDGYGNPYLLGSTTTPSFPITTVDLYKPNGGSTLFLTKFARDGSKLLYSAPLRQNYYGATNVHLALDAQGQAIVSGGLFFYNDISPLLGFVQKDTFETCVPDYQATCGYVQRYNSSASGYVYSTFYGGPRSSFYGGVSAVTTDILGSVIIGGTTTSSDLILVNPFQPKPAPSRPSNLQGYLAKFSSPTTVSASNLRSFVEGYGRSTSAAADMRLVLSDLENGSIQTALTTLDQFDADVASMVESGQWAIHTGLQMHAGSKLLRQQIARDGAPPQ